jgi:hypothetical protein
MLPPLEGDGTGVLVGAGIEVINNNVTRRRNSDRTYIGNSGNLKAFFAAGFHETAITTQDSAFSANIAKNSGCIFGKDDNLTPIPRLRSISSNNRVTANEGVLCIRQHTLSLNISPNPHRTAATRTRCVNPGTDESDSMTQNIDITANLFDSCTGNIEST